MDHGLDSLLRSLHFPTNICWVHVARVMIVHAAHTPEKTVELKL